MVGSTHYTTSFRESPGVFTKYSDYGILEDKVKIIEINSLEDAQDELFKIFNSRKVKYIIQEMLKSSGENDDKV